MQQGLSPLQIQTIKLLELPTLELEQRIKKELEENPVLDEAAPSEESEDGESKNVSLSDYNQDDSTPSYRLYVNNQGKDLKPQYNTFSVKESFHQNLEMQLGYSDLKGDDRKIAMFVIGSIDDDGYLRRDIESLTDDIAFRLNIETTSEHVEKILKVIQEFEPVGVGARDLRECLLLQLRVKEQTPERKRAEEILENYFEEFSRKHYDKIMARTGMNKDELKDAVDEIVHLNPRPGGQIDDSYVEQAQQIVPDFILENKDGELLHAQVLGSGAEGQQALCGPADELGSVFRQERKGSGFVCKAETGFGQMVRRGYQAAPEHSAEYHEGHPGLPA